MTPPLLTFKYPWRAYQARILGRLELYRDDRKIHVVAPPGAGKTVLGLEIMRRIGKRALVLAPSLTIRAQWTERYIRDFGADEAHISNDLYAPGALTIVTYQAMYAYHEKMGTDGLDWAEVLVVDECHHLRREWWRVLDGVMERYQPELVALTATPPYDVSGVEWRRYHSFCGEIDEEISIPELVASGDLCPHQDFIYPILPPPGESRLITEWQQRKDALLELVHTRGELAYFVRQHPWLADPEAHYEDIFATPEYFTALLSILRAQGSEPPATALGVLHGETTLAPALDDHWLTLFLQRALRDDDYFTSDRGRDLLRPYKRALSAMGAWHDGKLHLAAALPPASGAEAEQLESPQAKLDAMTKIAAFESDALVNELRMVILTDNIYDEFLPTTEHDRRALTRVGTVPVFETLRRQEGAYYRDTLCILTGSLVVIPQAAEHRLLEIAYDQLPDQRVIKTAPLFPDSKYVVVDTGTLANKYAVGWLTQLFMEGLIHIIVGTKSLLGEGWDAPVVNSLVLANRVGSFVLSNQMRGRAIRTVRGQPDKTANIWHPMIVHPTVRRGGPDVDRMRRRFRGFAGPRLDGKPAIQNGLERYSLLFTAPAGAPTETQQQLLPADRSYSTTDAEAMTALRRVSLQRATERSQLAERWTEALGAGTQLVEAIRPPQERYYERKDPLTLHYRESIDRHVEEQYRLLLLNMKVATMVSLLVGTIVAAVLARVALPLLIVSGVLAVIAVPAGVYFYRHFAALRRQVAGRLSDPNRNPAFDRELKLRPYVVFPLLFALLLLPFGYVASLSVLTVYSLWMAGCALRSPVQRRNEAVRRHTLLSNTRERLLSYGKALAGALGAGEHFHVASPDNLKLEEEGDEQFLYLSDAEHHDSQLFASSLAELMSPIDNPRYLLRLKLPDDWTRGEYYLAVPGSLGTRKDAEALAGALGESVDQEFEAIYTREPAGRLHLLTARLQASSKTEELARREMLWR
ncbi:DEAD/DEAH box helicase family protein [Neolewinella maritima]|uniref:DEAD/DEAH box helicase family protein n=1 Tax=Neolewinella maritima TaxID=1383882 RepID=UPI001EE95594|nr:DEAD/DEAH box helicase family protein [Neolewinella maritima]